MQEDLIGRKEIVEKIYALIKNLSKDEHFCLALDGEWGSGKSFVINMLEERLKTNTEYFIVKYDAWENSFYSDPLIAMLYCILDGLQENFHYIRGAKEYFVATKEIVKNVGEAAKDIAKAVDPTTKIEGVFNAISSIISGIKNSIKALKFDKTDNEAFKEFKSYKSLLNEVKDTLNKLTGFEINEGKQTKLIILVDEIDRCLPIEQLKVLERLHHLLDVHNCFVVCSLNKKSMTKSFVHNFDNDGAEYLKKFFDKELYLESLSENYLDKLLSIKLDEIAEIKNVLISSEQKFHLMEVLNVLIISLELECKLTDNREINRVWSSLYEIAKNVHEIENFNQVFLIIILAFLKNFSNDFYKRDLLTKEKVGKHFIDFMGSYLKDGSPIFANDEIVLQGRYKCNNYKYNFLNYFNCVLNYYHFGEQVVGFTCRQTFKVDIDNFIEHFDDILKKVETYGK